MAVIADAGSGGWAPPGYSEDSWLDRVKNAFNAADMPSAAPSDREERASAPKFEKPSWYGGTPEAFANDVLNSPRAPSEALYPDLYRGWAEKRGGVLVNTPSGREWQFLSGRVSVPDPTTPGGWMGINRDDLGLYNSWKTAVMAGMSAPDPFHVTDTRNLIGAHGHAFDPSGNLYDARAWWEQQMRDVAAQAAAQARINAPQSRPRYYPAGDTNAVFQLPKSRPRYYPAGDTNAVFQLPTKQNATTPTRGASAGKVDYSSQRYKDWRASSDTRERIARFEKNLGRKLTQNEINRLFVELP